LRIEQRTVRRLAQGWLALVAIGLATLLAMSAHAGLRAVAAHREPAISRDVTIGYEADDHFPGAALLLAEEAPTTLAAPAAGVTGTADLPALPVPAAVADAAVRAEPAGVTPALPFSLARASATDRMRAQQCLTAAIYYEAGSEPQAGQQAVAQVVLNRARHPAFPATVCGVVYQGSEKAGCQFSFACDGAMRRSLSAAVWARAGRVAAAALAGYVFAPVGLATHYHTYAVTPAWNRSLVMTDMVGAHLFHRWKGYWGTAAAFRQTYVGGEPMPGPHLSLATAPTVPVDTAPVPNMPVATADRTSPVPFTEDIRSAYADSGTTTAPAEPANDRLPAASAVLPKWKGSGTLR
jgi:spore germination cell wall hydrolase CwlJ-like protein